MRTQGARKVDRRTAAIARRALAQVYNQRVCLYLHCNGCRCKGMAAGESGVGWGGEMSVVQLWRWAVLPHRVGLVSEHAHCFAPITTTTFVSLRPPCMSTTGRCMRRGSGHALRLDRLNHDVPDFLNPARVGVPDGHCRRAKVNNGWWPPLRLLCLAALRPRVDPPRRLAAALRWPARWRRRPAVPGDWRRLAWCAAPAQCDCP